GPLGAALVWAPGGIHPGHRRAKEDRALSHPVAISPFVPCTSTRAAFGRPLFVLRAGACRRIAGIDGPVEPEAKAELEKLQPLVGHWTVEAVAPWMPPGDLR